MKKLRVCARVFLSPKPDSSSPTILTLWDQVTNGHGWTGQGWAEAVLQVTGGPEPYILAHTGLKKPVAEPEKTHI